jgi:hypothetical protein
VFVALKRQNEHFADVDSVLPRGQKWERKSCLENVPAESDEEVANPVMASVIRKAEVFRLI